MELRPSIEFVLYTPYKAQSFLATNREKILEMNGELRITQKTIHLYLVEFLEANGVTNPLCLKTLQRFMTKQKLFEESQRNSSNKLEKWKESREKKRTEKNLNSPTYDPTREISEEDLI